MKKPGMAFLVVLQLAGCVAATPCALPPHYGKPGSEYAYDKVVDVRPDARWST